jgi:hypothetical protein
MMFRLKEVVSRPGFVLYLKYEDGTEGEIDLSYLAGRGVFSAWDDRAVFESVTITAGGLEWPGGIDLCEDSLYLRLTGKKPEDIMTPSGRARESA